MNKSAKPSFEYMALYNMGLYGKKKDMNKFISLLNVGAYDGMHK